MKLCETKWYYAEGVGRTKNMRYLCTKIKVRFYRRRAHEPGACAYARESNPKTDKYRYSRKES